MFLMGLSESEGSPFVRGSDEEVAELFVTEVVGREIHRASFEESVERLWRLRIVASAR